MRALSYLIRRSWPGRALDFAVITLGTAFITEMLQRAIQGG